MHGVSIFLLASPARRRLEELTVATSAQNPAKMADDDSVKLQSGDNEVFSVSKEVACQAVTIKEMLEGPSAPPLLPSPVSPSTAAARRRPVGPSVGTTRSAGRPRCGAPSRTAAPWTPGVGALRLPLSRAAPPFAPPRFLSPQTLF